MTCLMNLLPWRPRLRRRRCYLWGGSLLFGLIIQGGLVVHEIAQQKTRAALLESQNRQWQTQRQTQDDIHLQPPLGETDTLQAFAPNQTISRAQQALQGVFASLLAESGWLRALNWQPYLITLEGTTQSLNDLQAITRRLTALPAVRQVTTGTVLDAGDNGLDFTFLVAYGGA